MLVRTFAVVACGFEDVGLGFWWFLLYCFIVKPL